MLDELFSLLVNTYRRWPPTEPTAGPVSKGKSSLSDARLPLRLYPGQVVRATVLAAGSDWARVQVDGQPLLASLKTPLSAGRTVWLEVERLAPTVHFRLLSEVSSPSAEAPRLLRALKLSTTPGLLQAVCYLTEQRLPFDARLLRKLHHWRQGAYLNEQGLQAAVHLQMRQFPLRFPLFYAVYQALADPRQQRAHMMASPALARVLSALEQSTDGSTFRYDLVWKRLLSALRAGGGEQTSFGSTAKSGEGNAILLGHAILQFPVTYGDAWAFYSFPLPPWLPFYGWMQLSVPKERAHGRPRTGHLQLELHMPRLHQLQVRIYWQENVLTLTIFTSQPILEAELREEEERLRSALAKLGFVVRHVHWQRLDTTAAVSRWLPEGVDVRC